MRHHGACAGPARFVRLAAVVGCVALFAGCREVKVSPNPSPPKQGDNVNLSIWATEPENVAKITYNAGGHQGSATTSSVVVPVDTGKDTGQYLTSLPVSAAATYKNGQVVTRDVTYDLTAGSASREGFNNTYAIYVSTAADVEDVDVGMANAFMDEFGSYSRSQYYWAQPRFFTNDSLYFADSVDMAISFGHGSHHYYYPDGTGVDLSGTAYGSCATSNATGDLEYLVFATCQTLSMDDSNGKDFWSYWFHDNSTKLGKRPFEGLHMVLGFRTNFTVYTWDYWIFGSGCDGNDFFEEYAGNLDDGKKVVDAWLDAVDDELSFDDGDNRGAVLYLATYRNDTITSQTDDFIYGNPNYSVGQHTIEYFE